jgi:integrase
MASLQIRNNKFVIQYYHNGTKRTRSTGLLATEENKLKAEKMKELIESKLISSYDIPENGSKKQAEEMTLSEAIEKFKKVHLSLKSISHRRNFGFVMEHLKGIIGKDILISDITTEHISDFIGYLKARVSNATLHTYIRYAKMLFNYLEDEDLIKKTPFRKRQIPRREDREIEIFGAEDLDTLFNYISGKDFELYKFLNLLLLLGTRPIDLVNLRFEDIKLEQRKINIQMAKTGNLIVFPIYDELGKFLINNFTEFKNGNAQGKLFKSFTVSHVGKKFRRYLKVLKIPKTKRYTLKTFRKTFGTNMAAINIPTKDLMYLMGHREVETTMKYYIKAKAEEIGKRINIESKRLIEMPPKLKT